MCVDYYYSINIVCMCVSVCDCKLVASFLKLPSFLYSFFLPLHRHINLLSIRNIENMENFCRNRWKQHYSKYLILNFQLHVSAWKGSTAMCRLCMVWLWNIWKIWQNNIATLCILLRLKTAYIKTAKLCQTFLSFLIKVCHRDLNVNDLWSSQSVTTIHKWLVGKKLIYRISSTIIYCCIQNLYLKNAIKHDPLGSLLLC